MGTCRRAFGSVLAGAVILVACAPRPFVYAPVSTTSAEIAGSPAVVYALPPDDPRGDVSVAMLGLAALRPDGIDDSTLRAVHVALEVRNRSHETWTIEPSEAHLELTSTHGRSDVTATSARIRPLPRLDVPAGGHAVLHLYFPLPLHLQSEKALAAFDVLWTLRFADRAVTERTSFQRFLAAPPASPTGRYPHEL
jgi:hypothetical protein